MENKKFEIYTEDRLGDVVVKPFNDDLVEDVKSYAERKNLIFEISQQEWSGDGTLYLISKDEISELDRSKVKFSDGSVSAYIGSYVVEDNDFVSLMDVYSSRNGN